MRLVKIIHLIGDQLFGFIEWVVDFFPNPIGSRLRYLYWRLRLKSLGTKVVFGVGIKIAGPRYVSIGNHCWIDDYVLITAGPPRQDGRKIKRTDNPDCEISEGEISIGDYVHIAPFVVLQGHGGIFVGNCLTIASGAKIYTVIHHYEDNENHIGNNVIYKFVGSVPPEEQLLISSPVVIHNNAAVGLNSVILPGSIIGLNSWLGAQSLLKGVLPDNVIAYGSPAKIIKKRIGFDK